MEQQHPFFDLKLYPELETRLATQCCQLKEISTVELGGRIRLRRHDLSAIMQQGHK